MITAMLGALAPYQKAFAGRDAQVHYAMKANSSLGVLQVFAQAGCERLSLGPSMPLTEIVTACLAVKPDIFAISFSSQNAPKDKEH